MDKIIAGALAVFCNFAQPSTGEVKFSIPHPCEAISIKADPPYVVFETTAPARGTFRLAEDGAVQKKTTRMVVEEVWTAVSAATAK